MSACLGSVTPVTDTVLVALATVAMATADFAVLSLVLVCASDGELDRDDNDDLLELPLE